jgi:formylglycine-generating enzyme required for sulfatase activity
MGQSPEETEELKKAAGEEIYAKYFQRELPRHTVSVDGFRMGISTVTVAEFGRFVEAVGYRTEGEKQGWSYGWDEEKSAWGTVEGMSWRKPGFLQGDDHPVVCVSWNDARAMLAWLNGQGSNGPRYRLPTEAEWEYACRAGSTTPFHFGETISPEQVNYDGNYPYGPSGKKGIYRQATVSGKSFAANGFGLYCMHGNVWEWCEDVFAEDFYDQPVSRRRNPCCDTSGAYRVRRGGSWGNAARNARAAFRLRSSPGFRDYDLGFRLVSPGQQ